MADTTPHISDDATPTTWLGTLCGFATGIGLGAAAMYLMDPDRGKKRRHQTRDQAVRLSKKTGRKLAATCKDLAHRTQGAIHETRKRLTSEQVPASKLVQQVRSELGHRLSNGSAVNVSARRGRVVLSGAVPETEMDDALRAAAAIPGVRKVHNRLTVDETEVS